MAKKTSSCEPTIRRQELGQELLALRKASHFTLEQAARRINVSASKLCRIESGYRPVTTAELGGLLSIYGADGAKRTQLLALARNCDERDWWQRHCADLAERQRTLIALESRAERIVDVEIAVMPGLLQTSEYTRALMAESGIIPETEIAKNLTTRQGRHSVLLERQPPKLVVIIHELALHQMVGGPGVMRRQLEYLLQWSWQPHVVIQVLPNTGAHPGASGSFILLDLPKRSSVVFLENLTSSLFVEEHSDVEVYQHAVRNLTSRVLDERQSREMIATVAQRLEPGASTHGANELICLDMAQEPQIGPARGLC